MRKNLEKGKCLTYLCTRIRQLRRTEVAGELKTTNAEYKPYTRGIADLYEWRVAPMVIGRLALLDALRAIGYRRGDSNDIRDNKQTRNYKQPTI